jgi:two-component system chemotaxis sensor kinase CheA
MPRLDGFAVLGRLQADPARRAIPVIVLSNLGQSDEVERALRVGASAFLIKSNLSLQELVAKVREATGTVAGADEGPKEGGR